MTDSRLDETAVPKRAASARRRQFGVETISVVMAITDLVIATRWVVGGLSSKEALFWHLLVAASVCGAAWLLQPRESIRIGCSLLVCVLLGPIAGIVLLIADLGHGAVAAVRPLNARTQVSASRAERLHAQISQNRRRLARTKSAAPFAEVFDAGTLARQQEVIAAISLSYRVEMLPALQQALGSEIPAIRVQAAAVFAKLRGQYGQRAKALLGTAAAYPFSHAMSEEARLIAASGFVDAETASALFAQTNAARVPSRPHHLPRKAEASSNALARPPRLKRYSCGGIA